MKLIVGLGNPGAEYNGTRHNVGFEVIDRLATESGSGFKAEPKFKSIIGEARTDTDKILLVKPQTYMNLSGEAVSALASFYKINQQDILIIHDEMDFSPGAFAFNIGSGAAGHNGVTSIQELLGTKEIARLRVGIGRPTPPMKKEDYVLAKFTLEERLKIDEAASQAVKAVSQWIIEGLTKTMNSWNGVKSVS